MTYCFNNSEKTRAHQQLDLAFKSNVWKWGIVLVVVLGERKTWEFLIRMKRRRIRPAQRGPGLDAGFWFAEEIRLLEIMEK